MFDDFKKFALKGNVIDMAIGVIIGGAFGKIVASFVSDIVMPVLTIITGKIKFENLFIALDGNEYASIAEAQAAEASTLNYGVFITSIIDFMIIAISIFIAFSQINRIQKKLAEKKEKPAPTVKDCPFCKSSIHKDAVKCPNCTSQLELPEPDGPDESVESSESSEPSEPSESEKEK